LVNAITAPPLSSALVAFNWASAMISPSNL